MSDSRSRLLIAAVALSVLACTEPDRVTTPSQPLARDRTPVPPTMPVIHPTGDNLLSDQLVPIDPAHLDLRSSEAERAAGVYRYGVVQEPRREVVVGDVIYGRLPGGGSYLRRVHEVERNSGELTLKTFSAQWHEVVRGGSYHVSGELPVLGRGKRSPARAVAGGGPALSSPLPADTVSLDNINLCTLVADQVGITICGGAEKTKVDKGVVELDGRLDSLALIKGSIGVFGTWDADYTIDPGGQLVLNTGRRPVFSPCDAYPNVTGCFSRIGTLLQSFLASVGIDPGVLPPPRVCIPGTPITIVPGSLFPFRLPTIRICKITDFGALPTFTPPFLAAVSVTLRPTITSDVLVDVAGTGTLKLDLPIPELAVVKCFDHGNGFFCLKAGMFFVVQFRAVEFGGQVQLNGSTDETVTLSWSPQTEWTHHLENTRRDIQAKFVPNNPADTLILRLGPAVELEAGLCFGTNASGCQDQGDGTTEGGGLIDLQLGVTGKASLGHFLDSSWSRETTFGNWLIDSDMLYEFELEGKLTLPRFLFRLDKNLKRSWTVPFLRHDVLDVHGTGILEVETQTTGADPDPDGYTVTVARLDTLPGIGTAGVQRIGRPNWADTLRSPVGPNETITFTPAPACLTSYSDAFVTGAPLARRLGLNLPNYATETGCNLLIADYRVTLGGVQDNCIVTDGPTHQVRLTQARAYPTPVERTLHVTFAVNCPAPPDTPGALQVTAVTDGFTLDPDGYQVTLDGTERGPIATNGTATFTDLIPGTGRLLDLHGLAPNCSVSETHPKPVDITTAGTTVVTIQVFCGPIALPDQPPSELRVRTTTTGSDPDPDGYALTVNGAAAGAIGNTAEVLVSGLQPGVNVAALGDIAPNCAATGGATASTKITPGATGLIEFTITCAALPEGGPTGSVRVAVTTTGQDPDPNGYQLKVGSGATPVGVNETVTVGGLAPGSANLSLQDVAPNCTVQGANPQSVSVSIGSTTDVAIAVVCDGNAGVDITTRTSGVEQDADGYRIIVDGIDRGAIGTFDAVHVGGLIAGQHAVYLDGLAANCTISGSYPALPDIAAGATGAVEFDVGCIAMADLGAVLVKVSGPAKRAIGPVQILLDGTPRGMTAASGELLIPQVLPGDHLIELDGLGAGCRWTGQYPRQIKVNKGTTSHVTLNLVCDN